MKLKIAAYLLCAVSLLSSAQSRPEPKADEIFLHGNIYTGARAPDTGCDGPKPLRSEAIASKRSVRTVKSCKLKARHRSHRSRRPLRHAGFNDAHAHLGEAGLQGLTVNLTGVQSLTEFRERIKARVATATPGEWIVGGGWDETLWPVKEVPTRWDIDEVTTDHPVLLERVDGHAAVANTRALQMASITLASKDPQGGQIVRDTTGQPNGVLRDTAIEAVDRLVPRPLTTGVERPGMRHCGTWRNGV